LYQTKPTNKEENAERSNTKIVCMVFDFKISKTNIENYSLI